MPLLAPEQLIGVARNAGLAMARSHRITLDTGKNFQLLEFRVRPRSA